MQLTQLPGKLTPDDSVFTSFLRHCILFNRNIFRRFLLLSIVHLGYNYGSYTVLFLLRWQLWWRHIYILISSPEFANRLEKTYLNDLSNSGTRVRQTFMSWGTSQLDLTYGKNRIGKTKKRTNRDWLGGWVKQTGWVGGAPALPLGGRPRFGVNDFGGQGLGPRPVIGKTSTVMEPGKNRRSPKLEVRIP